MSDEADPPQPEPTGDAAPAAAAEAAAEPTAQAAEAEAGAPTAQAAEAEADAPTAKAAAAADTDTPADAASPPSADATPEAVAPETGDAAPSDEAPAAEPESAPDAKPERLPLVVIEADSNERARVEGFAETLDRPVRAIAPDALLPAALAELAQAAAVVVAWDLGGRAGLDVLDAIARVRGAVRPRMALAADGATRAMVTAAVRSGAQGFLARPYDADELAALLEGAP